MAGTGSQDEIRKLIDELTEAQNSGDAPRLRTMLSERDDAVHIGTDAEEWWTSSQLIDGVAADRVTGVLVREGGQWKVVQSHASIAVPNADIFG